MISSTLYALSLLAAAARALPLALAPRDVVAPPITYPTAGVVWQVGSTQTVTWDTSNLPPPQNITNIIGQIVLGYLTTDNENLNFSSPLAEGFNITIGSMQIVVPDVPYRTNYIIDLMGDSGNISPEFTIAGGSSNSTGSSSASASAPSSTAVSSSATPVSSSAASESPSATPEPTSAPASSSAVVPGISPTSSSVPSSTPIVPSSTPVSSASGTSAKSSSGSSATSSFSSSSSTSPSTTPTVTRTSGAWSWKRARGLTSLAAAALTALVVL